LEIGRLIHSGVIRVVVGGMACAALLLALLRQLTE